MSALFSPIKLRGLELPNRIMVAPMCQYSAENGEANDWHFTHINTLALSGAAMFCIEATHVEAIGRITPGCLGLWNDATEAALKPILASVRKHSKTAVAMQLAHAGRKGSSHQALGRRPADPAFRRRLADGRAVRGAAQGGRGAAARVRCGRACAGARRLRRRRQARRAARHRRARAAQRARLPAASVPVADLQQAHRRLWRKPAEPHALSAGSVRRDPRGVSAPQAGRHQGVGDRLGRGRLGPSADHRIRPAN